MLSRKGRAIRCKSSLPKPRCGLSASIPNPLPAPKKSVIARRPCDEARPTGHPVSCSKCSASDHLEFSMKGMSLPTHTTTRINNSATGMPYLSYKL